MTDKEKKQVLVFGYGLSIILSVIGIKLFIEKGWTSINIALSVSSIILIVITRFRVRVLEPIYTNWMKVAQRIGNLVTGVLLAIIYYSLFSMIGGLSRILKKDFLNCKIDPEKVSYWEKREQGFDGRNYTKQF